MVRDHFGKLPSRYALNVEAGDVLVHMRLMTTARKTGRITVDVREYTEEPSTPGTEANGKARSVITISCLDRPNLLDSITRIITRLSSTIQDADCMTSKDGLTLDRFTVEHVPPEDGRMGVLESQALTSTIERVLNAEESIHNLSPSRVWRHEDDDVDDGVSASDDISGRRSHPTLRGGQGE